MTSCSCHRKRGNVRENYSPHKRGGRAVSWREFFSVKNLGGVCIYSQTGIATPCGSIFKETFYGSIRGFILPVRVVKTRISFSIMGLVRPKACRGTGGGGGWRGRQPLPVGVERRLVFVGDASKVLRNLVVNTFFKTTRDVLFFLYTML